MSVDQDELFDYPFSDVVSLKALLRYLSENSYTAVVAYMLDMFPERLFEDDSHARDMSLEELKRTSRFYDISGVIRANYHDVGEIGNVLSNEEVSVLRGGVRERLFGVRPMLTKHPLVFFDDRLKPMDLSDHWAGNARVADFTGILMHYKLTNSLYGVVRQEIRDRRQLDLQKDRYGEYFKVLDRSPSLLLKNEASRELGSVNELVGTPFATVSRQYMGFVEGEERRLDPHAPGISSERMYEPFFNALAEAAAQRAAAREARQEAQEKQERARAERENAREAGEKARRAEEQIRAIQSSRSWRILTGLGRIKGRLRRGAPRDEPDSAPEGRN